MNDEPLPRPAADPGPRPTPALTLNNGVTMPQLGLGVWQAPPAEAADAVRIALGLGYRLVDTAASYGNEDGVGAGLAASDVPREEVFLTTKLRPADYAYDAARRAFDRSRALLGVDYVDLYLLHWPVPASGDDVFEAYRAAEAILRDGGARAIGVCNHPPHLLERLLDRAEVVPAVNQIELHPYFSQRAAREADAALGIVTQSWSPIGGSSGSGGSAGAGDGRRLLTDPAVVEIAAAHGVTAAQAVLRWHLAHGLAVIPKSVHAERLAQNLDVFGFDLEPDEVARLDALDSGRRGGPDPDEVTAAWLAGAR